MSDRISLNYSGSLARYKDFAEFYSKEVSNQDWIIFNQNLSIGDNLKNLAIKSLDPNFTVGIIYSFRQISLDLVSRWIVDDEIEYESSKLLSHEHRISGSIVLSAMGRIVSLTPEVAPFIEYFLSRSQIFTLLQQKKFSNDEIHDILLAFYRLFNFDFNRFSKYIEEDLLVTILNTSDDSVIKLLAIHLLCKSLSLAENVKMGMIDEKIGASAIGNYEGDNVDYKLLGLLEAKRITNFQSLKSVDIPQDVTIDIDTDLLSSLVVSVSGILVPKIHLSEIGIKVSDLVPTERSIDILKSLAFHVQHSSPVMLVGSAGSGKTFLIDELSKYLSCDKSIVKIHLGEQTDAKLLLGTYTSGTKPGTFEWREGVLTTAIKEGRWVLIEDIDKAPTEVLSILLSLLEKRELTIPSRGEVIKAANGFQLISTIRVANDRQFSIPDIIGLRLWNVVRLDSPSQIELTQILTFKFPVLKKLVPTFLKLYQNVEETYNDKSFLILNKGNYSRVISVRDLLKFCKRVNLLFQNKGVHSDTQLLKNDIIDGIFSEAADCFAGAISEKSALSHIIKVIGEALEIASSRIELFTRKNVPIYEETDSNLTIGRACLTKFPASLYKKKKTGNITSFARTNHSLRLMEQIGVAVEMTEPVLLVGETGTGKTTVVQQLAKQVNKRIVVINVSQQTETGDLLGGYKPINAKSVAVHIQEEFLDLFHSTFSAKKNERFEHMLIKCFNRNQWKNVIKLWNEAIKLAEKVLNSEEVPKKKRKLVTDDKNNLLQQWKSFTQTVKTFETQSQTLDNSFVFNFVEGSLVQAVRNGDWLLLDEINLASSDTLESISDLLAETQRSILLSEKGEVESIQAHEGFRIFACMNPATDVGKRDLPLGIRSRFSEVYVHSPDGDISDLLQIIDKYVGRYALSDEWVGNDIAQLYLEAKRLADSNQIVDGSNQKPHFSIRTLTRTLLYVCDIVTIYGLRRSLYEGFSMSFLTLLDQKSEAILKPLIEKFTIGKLKNPKSVISQIPPAPSPELGAFIDFKHYWIKKGPYEVIDQPNYIITPFVEKNLLNLVRATSGKRFPILVQGPTSSGKTSMIKYLADITGNKFVRINNHEHTDLQEYVGTYVSDDTGKLSFKEGILVEALRKGYWLVLDELNLAPTDVLEALNRLLDDNRELFIPETQEVVHPHPDFMLFATQNPPGIYGGRKVLSRAFRNRFLELHFDDIPQDELEIILKDRCEIAPSYATKIVEVYKELSVQRQSSRLFEQKNSFATLRDLFRWANREAIGYEQLAANGYMLLAERVRNNDEKRVVKEVLEKVMKVNLNMEDYYRKLENKNLLDLKSPVVWTKAMRRLAVLILSSLKNNEPILLVGETGCGKTTICQLLADYNQKSLVVINAHQNTETGDLLGAQRPLRNKSGLRDALRLKLISVLQDEQLSELPTTLDALLNQYDLLDKSTISNDLVLEIKSMRDQMSVLFEWTDGPLVQSLKSGSYFLLDEISLADDSVLERLNSVLEPERTLFLAEKGTSDSFITAADGFQFLATMNPGGDYGKKELSPALRNRFTEIWVPSMDDFSDVFTIVETKLDERVKPLALVITHFSENFGKFLGGGQHSSGVISLRDILTWVEFINKSTNNGVPAEVALLHGACMVFIDSLGTNNTAHFSESQAGLQILKLQFVKDLSELLGKDLVPVYEEKYTIRTESHHLAAGHFTVPRELEHASEEAFSFEAPTTAVNTMRVVRAMQLSKPILLEGSPGVGKTSLVSALAKGTGNSLTRINLSEQTDLIDLFGSDAPVEGGKTGEFSWRDAPFLRAMQKGEWVLLDEMNLASQSVLEGLNACLDHRGEAYIPELDQSFKKHPNFLVFAAQNPQYQGGGRKGLPKSFINRFSVVYVDTLTSDDLIIIARHLYPSVDSNICSKMIQLVSKLEEEIVLKKEWGAAGGPWEFNLRDTLRWLQLYSSEHLSRTISPVDFMDIIVCQRFRTKEDQDRAKVLVQSVFKEECEKDNLLMVGDRFVQSRKAFTLRNLTVEMSDYQHLLHLQCNVPLIETSLLALENNWSLIFVGPTNSGKTELVRLLSSIVGTKLIEFAMNSDVDSMDILGGYEQVDLTRHITTLIDKLTLFLKRILAEGFKNHKYESDAILEATKFHHYLSNTTISVKDYSTFLARYESFSYLVNDDIIPKSIKTEVDKLTKKIKEDQSIKFEWFDGLLVKAVEEGHWIVLDNANLCSPSVLDRLNSLLEINGSLSINECSSADGQPRLLKPHKNFRLFMTVDPKYGELSRAMRNRGVEVYFDPLSSRATQLDKRLLGIFESDDMNETTAEVSIENLSLTANKNPVVSPLSKNVAPNDSLTHHLSLIVETLSNDLHLEKTVQTIATIVPLIAQKQMESLSFTIQSSKEFSADLKLRFVKLVDYFKFLDSTGAISTIYTLYHSINHKLNQLTGSITNYVNYQPLNPLWNTVLYFNLFEDTSSEFFYFFEILANIYSGIQELQNAEVKGNTGKLNELNYLEIGAAVLAGRNIRKKPKVNVFKLLKDILDFIFSIMKDFSPEILLEGKATFSSLFSLTNVWLLILRNSYEKNDAKFRVYKTLLEKWATDSTICLDVSYIKDLISEYGSSISLDSGLLMSEIWETFRGIYPTSNESWVQYNNLQGLIQELDSVCYSQFSGSEELIASLGETVIALSHEIIDQEKVVDMEEDFDRIRSAIKQLKTFSSSFLVLRSHNFEKSFKLLFNLVLSSKGEVDRDLLELAHHSGLGFKALLSFQNEVYPRVFSNLWTKSKGTYESNVSYFFTDRFFLSVFENLENLNKFSGDQLNQTITDSSKFAHQLIKNSKSILSDKLCEQKRVLSSWYLKILLLKSVIPEELQDDKNFTDVSKLIEFSLTITDDNFFTKVNKSFLVPAMKKLINLTTLGDLGESWVLFCIGLTQLYVPNSPFDPAIEEHVHYEVFEKKKNLCDTLSESLRSIRRVYFGDSEVLLECLVPVVDSSDKPSKPRVFRSRVPIDNLFEEWFSFTSSTLNSPSLKSFLEISKDLGVNDLSLQMDVFQQNSSNFMERLSSQFSNFGDVNDIFYGYIYGTKLGFDLILEHKKQSESLHEASPMLFVDPVSLSSTSSFKSGLHHLKGVIKSIDVDSPIAEKLLRFLMLFLLTNGTHDLLDEDLNQVFQTIYYRWTLRRSRQERKEAEESTIFKYKDESNSDEEFKSMFPDYEEHLEVNAILNGGEPEGTMLEETAKLADAYISHFISEKSVSLKDFTAEGVKLLSIAQQMDFKSDKPTSGSLVTLIEHFDNSISSITSPATSATLDFYHGYSPSEFKRSVTIIEGLLRSVEELLKEWPEHSTLQILSRVSREYISFPVQTPIARLIRKIEQIYTFISEWEKYASIKVSLKKHFDELTSLIVSWRRLELGSWSYLLKREDDLHRQSLGNWWFNLFETIVVPALNGEVIDHSALISSINIFLSKCTYGEFGSRLDLLKAVTSHTKVLLKEGHSLPRTLMNIITFYEQFAPAISSYILNGRKKLQKEIEEIILLSSWKDVNIDALKQSARRSHHNLYKILRKYRDLISVVVTPLIENGLDSRVSNDQLKIVSPRFDDFDFDKLSKVSLIYEGLKMKNFSNIKRIFENMVIYGKNVEQREYPELQSLSSDVLKEMERLKLETPKEFKEDNKKLIAALKTQKRKLLTDTIRELRRIGLKSHLREDIHNVQASVNLILSKSHSFSDTILEQTDPYFFRIIDLIPRLRASVSNLAEGIPVTDAESGLAIFENLVFYLIRNRKLSFEVSKGYKTLISTREHFDKLKETLALVSEKENTDQLAKVKSIIQLLPQVLDIATQNVIISTRLSGVKGESSVFDSMKSSIKLFEIKLSHTLDFGSLFKEVEHFLEQSLISLETWGSECSQLSYIARMVIDWINNVGKISVSKMETENSLDELQYLVRHLSSKVLVVFQKVTEVIKSAPIHYEDDRWFTLTQTELSSLMSSLHSKSIIKAFHELRTYLSTKSLNLDETSMVKDLFRLVEPYMKSYIELTVTVLNKYQKNYSDLGHSTYVLGTTLYNLSKDGFCSPEPPSESKEDDNLHDGTGLGDGEGAQNNSNDVEDDEDLSEQAQEPNKEKDENNGEDDDNQDAVDIEGDMAGDLENLSDQEKDEDKDEDAEDNEDLDEEIDDLDDLDPNAVDDKMWDEEAQEDKKEKESDNVKDNSNPDDVEAKEEENEKESKDEASKDKENDPQENDDEAEDTEDVGEQEDEVKNEEREQLEENVPETETLELPDDINLDSDKDEEEDNSEAEGDEKDLLNEDQDDGSMDIDEDESKGKDSDIDVDEEDEDEDVDADGQDSSEEKDVDDLEEPVPDNTENEFDADENAEQEEALEVGDDSDDEDLQKNDADDENKQQDDEQNTGDNLEGIDGADNAENDEDIDTETAVEQQSGEQGDGAQTQADQEKEDVGASGSANNQEEAEAQEQQNDVQNSINESLKQLGDSLKEFHRRREEIKEATERDESSEQTANQRPDDFEHIEGENTDNDTQALGATNKDQVTSINDDMAIDDEEDLNENQVKPEEDDGNGEQASDENDAEIQDAHDQNQEEFNGKTKGGFIGERKQESSEHNEIIKTEFEDVDIDEQMSYDPSTLEDDESTIEIDVARDLWRKSQLETQELSANLCEQLRLILEPTLSTKLRGDYKTGKRLNMKRIIPYIASDFRKDKIWLRRTKPSKRQYQIMIAVDDSKSMSESKSVDLAFQSICLVSKALTQLESGGLSIVKFGEDTRVVHPFEKPFTEESGAKTFQRFGFLQTRTNIKKLVSESIGIFNNARALGDADLWQLQIIISDGVCEDHETIQKLVRRAREEKIMLVFVIIDGINSNESIMDMSQVKYVSDSSGNLVLNVDKYLDSFPFEFYVVVHDISELPKMLSLILRQYFSELASV